ncbi:class I SAM-dependent methyltransferase [Paenirhodobacter sp.]|uniref:class I SAM-dependent methyltransferase n=1 Tax=Paenirhodobacter sp. TaxID=1965326 RepID=UPI003B3FAC11
MSYDAEAARLYAGQNEHALPGGEGRAWRDLMAGLATPWPLAGRALDIGAGTGLLTAVLKDAGLTAVGLELARAMIAQGLRENPGLVAADFVPGSAGDADLFPRNSFDWIVSRQVLCHLSEVERSFAAWHRWLRPGGHVIVSDGFWTGSGSRTGQPFAALTSARPVADALTRAGFGILRAGPFDEANAARRAAFGTSVTRYVVVARKV